jgi:N-acetylmuramoyl-L-alanine amidase
MRKFLTILLFLFAGFASLAGAEAAQSALLSQNALLPVFNETRESNAAAAAQNLPVAITRNNAPGVKDLSLSEMINRLDAVLYWDSFFQSGIFSRNGHNIAFNSGERGERGFVLFDDRELFDLPLPYNADGNLYFPEEFSTQVWRNLEKLLQDDATRFRIAAIIVDPGHGGKDSGASGEHVINGKKVTINEKDITLSVSKELYEKLRAAYPDKRVLITRSGDTFPSLEDRVSKANSVPLKNNEAIIYVSVHANASFNKSARGYEVWYLDPGHKRDLIDKAASDDPPEIRLIKNEMLQEEYNKESEMMARMIADHFKGSFGDRLPFRGLKAEEWYVVRKARMPSILVELGFVTNAEDAAMMINANDLKKFSDSIYNGIVDFVASFEASGGFIAYQ